MPSAEIITIGTEILLGEIVDTNTRFLARSLRGLGVDLFRTITIGDNAQRIAEAIQDSMRRADIILTTGGLGPTVDDPTREAVARALGVETEFRAELWEQVKAVIARYGRLPGENQKRQAMLPRGSIAIENPVGTAPSFIVEFDSPLPAGEGPGVRAGAVISLPGVPQEMETIFHRSVVPYLQKKFNLNEVIKVRLLHTSGMGEAAIDEQVGEFERLANPTVGLAAHAGVVDIRLAVKAKNENEADRLIAEVETAIRARLGNAVFGVDEETLERAALEAAAARGWNVAALESGLDGRLARGLSAAQPANLVAVESPALSEVEVPALSEVEVPALSEVEVPALSEVEVPALSEVEVPALSEAEVPALSEVEVPALSEVEVTALQPGELAARTRQLRERSGAKAALGVALFRSESEQAIELHLVTPEGEKSQRLTYGGPPNYSPRWAGNMALNWLRLMAGKTK